jgi:hypothetical protein
VTTWGKNVCNKKNTSVSATSKKCTKNIAFSLAFAAQFKIEKATAT